MEHMRVPRALLLLLLVTAVKCSCYCDIVDSDAFPGTFVVDCTSGALYDLPTGCADLNDNITELWMSYNRVTEIRSTSLVDLTNLRVLRLDNNNLNFVDPTAFEFMHDLEKFKIDHNVDVSLDFNIFAGQDKLREISMIGTNQGVLPDISTSPQLNRVDVRSSQLTALPLQQLLHPQLETESVYFNMLGNDMPDMAGSSLMDLPNASKIFLDTEVHLWVRSEEEKTQLMSRPWDINIDLTTVTFICEEDGLPGDLSICFD